MLLVDPDAIAVVVSALFGGDPDLPVEPIDARPVADRDSIVASLVFEASPKALNGSGERALQPALSAADGR